MKNLTHLITGAMCMSLLLVWTISCKKTPKETDNSGPLATYTGVKTISAIPYNPLPTHPEYDNIRVNYTLTYNNKQLINAVPDKYQDVFGTIYFGYDNERLIKAYRNVKDPATGTLVRIDSLGFTYNGDKLDKIFIYNGGMDIQSQYSFFYTVGRLSKIVETNNYNSNFYVSDIDVNNDGNIYHVYNEWVKQNVYYTVSAQRNNLFAALPVWAAMTLIQMRPYSATYPLYMNSTLTSAMFYDSGASRTDYIYEEANEKITRQVSTFAGTQPDTVIYGY